MGGTYPEDHVKVCAQAEATNGRLSPPSGPVKVSTITRMTRAQWLYPGRLGEGSVGLSYGPRGKWENGIDQRSRGFFVGFLCFLSSKAISDELTVVAAERELIVTALTEACHPSRALPGLYDLVTLPRALDVVSCGGLGERDEFTGVVGLGGGHDGDLGRLVQQIESTILDFRTVLSRLEGDEPGVVVQGGEGSKFGESARHCDARGLVKLW